MSADITMSADLEQETLVTFKILVDNKFAGGVIGKGGATISSIKEASGARVKVSRTEEHFPGTNDRIILVQGSISAVLTASRLVVAELAKQELEGADESAEAETVTITVVIPAQASGLIIGKGGERINALREECQTKIQLQSKDRCVPGCDERTVTIVGVLDNAQTAVEKIIEIMYEDTTVHFTNLGTNYGPLNGMQAQLSHLTGLPLGYDLSAAFGKAAPTAHVAADKQVEVKFEVPEAAVGFLMGKGGSVITEVTNLTGAKIKVSQRGDVVPGTTNRLVTITGTPVASTYAHMLVLQKMPAAIAVQ